jgi:nucleoside-diphosphate-sugar epimerase
MLPTMRVLVTGGHGFVGSHLVEHLLEDGAEVRLLYRHAGWPQVHAGRDLDIVRGDLRDATARRAAVAGVDEVYHLAALTRARTRRGMLQTNAAATDALLRDAADAGVTGRFVFVSSLAAAGPAPAGAPLREAHVPRPVSWYGESKWVAEQACAAWSGRLPLTIVRPPAVYGPRDQDFVALFQAVTSGLGLVLGDPDRTYSLVHVLDLVDALVAAARSEEALGGTYFAAHPQVVTQQELLAAAEEACGRRARRIRLPASLLRLIGETTDLVSQLTGRPSLLGSQRMREVSVGHWTCSPEALMAEGPWTPTRDLRTGFRQTVEWLRAEGTLRSPGS